MEAEILIASSPMDAGVSCWDLHSGKEHLHFKPCASPPHGLTSVAGHFLASSQIRDSKHSSGSIFYWSWNKPQVEVRSFPAEPIKPLVSNSDGTYIAGGGISGDIYFWEVATGKLLKKWHAHYRAVSCLVFNDDQSLLISGGEDGCVRVWSLFLMFNDVRREEAQSVYEYSLHEHSLKVTDIKAGLGGCNAIFVSASEDRTCKVWNLSDGKLIKDIVFPCIIDAVFLDPEGHVFYAGGRDGKVYIAALYSASVSNSSHGLHIIDSLLGHSKAVTCLASTFAGGLVSGSEDGTLRVWNTRTRDTTRVFRHTKGSVNNVVIIRRTINSPASAKSIPSPLKRHSLLPLPPPLEKYANSPDENAYVRACLGHQNNSDKLSDSSYITVQTMEDQIKELERQGSSVTAEIELERLKSEQQKSAEMIQQWKRLYEKLHHYCVEEILDSSLIEDAKGPQI